MVHTEDLKTVLFIQHERTRPKVKLEKLYTKEAMLTYSQIHKAKLTLPSVKPLWCSDHYSNSQMQNHAKEKTGI